MKIPYIEKKNGEKFYSVNNHDFNGDDECFIDASFWEEGDILSVRTGGDVEYKTEDAFECHGYIRNHVKWGRSYNENGERVPTEYIPIKELNSSHIRAILEGEFGSKRVRHYLENELKYRNEAV